MKKIVFIVIFLLVILGVGYHLLPTEGFDIEVINQATEEVSGLYLTYDNNKTDIKIPPIESGDTYKLNVIQNKNSTEDFDEAALKLEYKDNKGNLQTEYVIGYFEKGYSGDAAINIISVDANGKLEIQIKENTSLY